MTRGRVGVRWAAAWALAAVCGAAEAAPVRIFKTQSAEAFLRGEAKGVAVESGGVLALAPGAEQVASLETPFAYAAARFGDGWAVATGNDGQLLAVAADGTVRVLFDAEESELFALAADRDGGLLAGASPGGKIYRIGRDGASEVLLDTDSTYVWNVARASDGSLWAATGDPGKLYRLREGAPAEVVWDGGATHVRSLLALPNGDVLFGTAGDGRLLRWRDGIVRTLHDSALTEVVALAPGTGGSIWVALLSSEASFVDLAPRSSPAGEETGGSVVVVEEGAAAGSRPAGSRGPRSELWRLLPTGAIERVWTSADETIFTLLAEGDRLWAGTGLGGRLYRFEGDQPRVEREFEAKQVVALVTGADGPVVLTTNAAELWRFTSRREPAGTYTSQVLDALQVARFGVFRWTGDGPGGAVRAAFRSGFSSEPDDTWSDWSEPREGGEIGLQDLDAGRFVQYRLELAGGKGASPRVVATELSYRQQNVRPSVDSVTVLDPGQIVVPAAFNPAEQLFEPMTPNRQGIFESLKPAAPREERLKGVYRIGWRTVRWEAQDPNGDDLRYTLEVRPEAANDVWLEIVADHDAAHFAFDSSALPDGLYRFRVTATDARGNPAPGEALSAAAESEVVVVDRTPPEMGRATRAGRRLTVEVYDAASPLREAELSLDGGSWKPLRVADGMLDGRREELVIDDLVSAKLVLLRVSDAAFNVRTFDLTGETKP